MTAKQARRKFHKLYKDVIVAHAYAMTTPKHGDCPWKTLKAIEEMLRSKKRSISELWQFCMNSTLAPKKTSRRKNIIDHVAVKPYKESNGRWFIVSDIYEPPSKGKVGSGIIWATPYKTKKDCMEAIKEMRD